MPRFTVPPAPPQKKQPNIFGYGQRPQPIIFPWDSSQNGLIYPKWTWGGNSHTKGSFAPGHPTPHTTGTGKIESSSLRHFHCTQFTHRAFARDRGSSPSSNWTSSFPKSGAPECLDTLRLFLVFGPCKQKLLPQLETNCCEAVGRRTKC